MATLALSLTTATKADRAGGRLALEAPSFRTIEPVTEPVAYERAVYQPSRRAGPVAALASAAVLLATGAALATLSIVAQQKEQQRLTVVAMKQLDTTPPPPPPPAKSLDKPVTPPEQAFVPKPMITLPAPGPQNVAMDLPPPIQPSVVEAPRVAVPNAPVAAAPVAATPVEGGDLSSQVISARPPVYPIDARRRREQGTVKLRVLVGPDGRVEDLQIAVSSGSDQLDKAALTAVRRWRWAPQKQNGQPVAVRGMVPVTFALA